MDPNDAELREAMRELLTRMAAAGWMDASLVSDEWLNVHFTPLGLEKLAEFDRLMEVAGWPADLASAQSLMGLCRRAAEQRF